ncbi:MAG TPA: tetratricopeptide repeat protein [Steroidobacteraceae bacterium]|nr:tetratricopeptide repeat protein [Steroidobacteraceae bacterium]
MQGLINTLRPLLLGGLLLTVPFAASPKNVTPDPNGLAPHAVEDLAYGDVLFYFYEDDYFDSITRLLAARQLGRVPHTQEEAELLLGGLYLSLGEHVEAGRIFEALLNKNTSEFVRNRAWFYLGKVWYQRGYLDEAERALRQVSDKMDQRINAERYMLLAQLMMRQGRYDEAIATLSSWHGAPDWTAYAQFNLGVALVRRDRLPEAISYLDRVGNMQTRSEELLALKDKANLALGFALLQAQRAAEARPILQRVRLEGPYSSKALLGVGWADAGMGEFKRALVPWLALRKRSLLDSAVQESFLTVPYAYAQLAATGQAADFYNSAIESFDSELKRIDDSIEGIRSGKLLDRLLNDDKKDTLTWYWQLTTVPNAPESRYLYALLASNEFQEGLKNYRELNFMSRNLDDWRDDVSAYDDMLDTRQEAYNQRVPKADAVLAATDLDRLTQKRVDFESRINEIEKSNDVAALGTPEEQQTWARLKRIEEYLTAHPDDPNLSDIREKHRLMKGVMYWRLSESFRARLWNERRSVKELEGQLKETQKRAVLVKQARVGTPLTTGGYASRVAAVRARIDQLHERMADVSGRQNLFLQSLAIRELEAQKVRIETYQVQARYELAAIYDRISNGPPKSPPSAAPNVTPGTPPNAAPDAPPNPPPQSQP